MFVGRERHGKAGLSRRNRGQADPPGFGEHTRFAWPRRAELTDWTCVDGRITNVKNKLEWAFGKELGERELTMAMVQARHRGHAAVLRTHTHTALHQFGWSFWSLGEGQ